MSRKIIFEAIGLLLVFASIWGIFTLFPIFPDRTAFTISVPAEEKLGKLMLESILSDPEFRQVTMEPLDSAILIITRRLEKAVGLTNYDFTVKVVDNPNANAFALPGGSLLVTTSLIELCESPEELAAVLAHEIAHIEKRHVTTKLIKEFTLSLMLSDNAVLSEATRTMISTAFNRRQEEEADRLSLKLLESSEINPRILGTFFRRLKEEEGAYNPKYTILMSHPHINSRIKAAFEYKPEEDFREVKFEMDWERIKNRLKRMHPKDVTL
jgi:predicted Zn-dependent protease